MSPLEFEAYRISFQATAPSATQCFDFIVIIVIIIIIIIIILGTLMTYFADQGWNHWKDIAHRRDPVLALD